jgi:hypothetical protein
MEFRTVAVQLKINPNKKETPPSFFKRRKNKKTRQPPGLKSVGNNKFKN